MNIAFILLCMKRHVVKDIGWITYFALLIRDNVKLFACNLPRSIELLNLDMIKNILRYSWILKWKCMFVVYNGFKLTGENRKKNYWIRNECNQIKMFWWKNWIISIFDSEILQRQRRCSAIKNHFVCLINRFIRNNTDRGLSLFQVYHFINHNYELMQMRAKSSKCSFV